MDSKIFERADLHELVNKPSHLRNGPDIQRMHRSIDWLYDEREKLIGEAVALSKAQGPLDRGVMRLEENKRRDLLDLEYINSLPLPLWDGEWPVYDIDVETGLYRIDVCGLLDVRHIGRCFTMRDATGKNHYVGDLYLDPDEWEERAAPETHNK